MKKKLSTIPTAQDFTNLKTSPTYNELTNNPLYCFQRPTSMCIKYP